jgi:pentatricopeptide repeat protein
MSSMQTASRKFHATAATQDPIAQLSAIFGDTVAKQIAEKNKLALRVVDIPGKFAVLVEAMGGGTTGENRAKKIVLQNITVLDVADIEGRFGELTAIMGGDEERARGVLQQSPTVLMSADIEGHFGVLTAIMGNEVRKADDEEEEAPAKKAKSAGGKSAKVFVGGLPWDVTEGELEDFFKDCGTIESIDQQVGYDGRSNGIAYVFFSDSSEAEKACELHDQQLGDRWLKIEKASNRTEGVYPYNSLVQQFVKEGDVAGARGVMAEMREAGVRCNASV